MLGYEQALHEAADLEARTSDRPLETAELFVGNDYYGMAAVLKEYAGLPAGASLRALVPHGVYLNDHLVARAERRCGLPAVLAYPPYREPAYRRQTSMAVITAAAPFVYALRLVAAEPAPERRGILVFPVHSTRFITAESDFEAIADQALALADEGEVRVCLYFRDLQLGRGEPFARRGLEVVCAGHINDPHFLFRLAHLLRAHERAVGTSLGSHSFYAEVAGCPFELLPIPHTYAGDARQVRRDAPELTPEREREVDDVVLAFDAQGAASPARRRALAERYLGTEHALEPARLAEQLLWCETLDRRGRLFTSGAPAGSAAIPAVVRRPVLRAGDAAGTALRRSRARLLGVVPRGVKDAAKRGLESGR